MTVIESILGPKKCGAMQSLIKRKTVTQPRSLCEAVSWALPLWIGVLKGAWGAALIEARGFISTSGAAIPELWRQ